MAKFVQISGGPRLSFPDDATEEQISQVLSKDYAPPTPEQGLDFALRGGLSGTGTLLNTLQNPAAGQAAQSGREQIALEAAAAQRPPADGLERAARDFAGLQSIGMQYRPAELNSPAALVGKAFANAGQAIKASLGDLGELAFGEAIANVSPETAQPDAGEPPTNLEAFAQRQPLPAETQLRVLPPALEVTGRAAQGLAASAPQLAAVMGSEAVGVPPWISGPIVFGSTPEGFSPEQGAIAAALPFVGRFGGEITSAIAQRFGVSSTEAMNLFAKAGGSIGAAAYLATIDASQVAGLPEDQKHAAMIDAVANSIGQLALGGMGVEDKPLRPAELAGAELQRALTTLEPGEQRDNIERQALAGGAPVIEPGRRPMGPPVVTPQDLPEPKPAPRPKQPPARAPGRLFRPEVPGTPPEVRRSAVEEIRLANARTTRQIQELFPKAQLSREQARVWREAAWPSPSGEATEANAPEEPAGPEEAAPEPTKEQIIQGRLKAGLDRKDLQVVVAKDPSAPAWGFVQVDETHPTLGNTFSSNPEQLRQLGLEMPSSQELMTLPAGKYSLAQAETLLAKPAASQPPGAVAFSASTPLEGVKVKGHYVLADALAVTTSDDLGYDRNLQPRDRTRVASQQQIASMVRGFEAQRLGSSATTDLGAPIIDEEGQVLSGNGRTMAIRQKYLADQGHDYKDWLVANAAEFGLDPQRVKAMAHPILVRRVSDYGGLDKAEFARQSNQQQVAGMSQAEKAAADAKMLLGARGLLESFNPGPEGNVLAATNRGFLNAFIKGTGEQNELLSKEGYNAPVLAKRVRNAVLGALIGPENRTLLNALLEESDQLNLKSAVNGVMSSAPALMRYKATPYDVSSLTAQALKDLVSLRTTGEKLNDFLENKPLFADPGRTAESDMMLKFLHEARSLKAVSEGLNRYATGAAQALQDLQSGGMLGLAPATRQQLIERATNGQPQPQPQAQQAELQRPGQPSPEPAGPPGPAPETLAAGPAPGQEPVPGAGQLRIAKSAAGPGWDLIEGPVGQGRVIQSGLTKRQAEQFLESPPPSSQGEGARTPYKRSQGPSSAFYEPETAFSLNPDQLATQAADRELRAAQQARDEPLSAASQALAEATAPAPHSPQGQGSQGPRAAGPGLVAGSGPAGSSQGPRLFPGLRRIFAAGTVDGDAEVMAGIIRHALGAEYELGRRADFALRPFRGEFDKTPVGRNWKYVAGLALPRNYEVMRAIDTGDVAGLTPLEAGFSRSMRRLFDQAIDLVQQVSPESLRELVENYFPRIWDDPVKNQAKINQLLSRRPWEGPKSFLRKRVLQYFTDGLELGLRPVSDNPVDVTLHKLGEMYRFVATRQAMEEAKARGLRRFVYIYEQPPGHNWRQVDDPSSTVHAPPVVTVKEAFDAQIRAKTLELLDSLGVPHERLVNIGGRRWGYAEPGSGRIVTKFGGPDAVLWHEFGHQMDFRYPDLRDLLPNTGNSTLARELRDLADLRFEGQQVTPHYQDYVRQYEEKLANLFDAYLRAPAKFQDTAPNVWRVFGEWLDRHPEVKNPLNEIKPSLRLGVGSSELFLGGPVVLGKWMMPEGAAQVVDNYLKPGLGRYQWFRSLREISGLVNGIQLAGFFHGGFVLNDSFYSGLGLSLYDVLNGKVARGLAELAQTPVSPLVSIYRGHKIKAAIENPAAANATYRQLANLATEQNLRAGHGNFDPEFSRRWTRAMHELMAEPSIGAAWETLWRAPMAATQLAMKPVMEGLVPRMKLGIYARMAERVIADNPGADTLTLRKLLAKAADATEDRLGQVTYDNLFQARALKDVMQLSMRAYGWQLTKYRMTLGGITDWARAGSSLARGEKPEVTFRMTYLPAMVMGHALLGGVLHYALTGRRPDKLTDYLFPETGLVDAFGAPVRVAIADFVKDYVADLRAFPNPTKMAVDLTRKAAPFWSMAAEMYRNQDFWGTEIFSRPNLGEPRLDHFMKNVWEGIQYLGKSALPFSVRGSSRLEQYGATKLGQLGPFVGIVPAPRYATQTKAEARADEIMRADLPKMAQTKEQAARGRAEAEIIRDIRLGKINAQGQLEEAARKAGINVHDARELTKLRQRVLWSPLQYQVNKMSVEQAMEIFDLATQPERISLAPVLAHKINNAFNGGRLEPTKAQRYVGLVMPFYRSAQQAQPAKPAAGAPRPFSAFNPQAP